MRVLIYGPNYAPEVAGVGRYTGDLGDWLVSNGQEVRVVTAPAYYPAWRKRPADLGLKYRREKRGSSLLWRCPIWVPERPTGLKRVAHLLSFVASSAPIVLWEAIRWRPHVIFTVEPPLFGLPWAWAVARVSGAKSWLHIQDFEAEAAGAFGIVASKGLVRLALSVERWALRRFDVVSSISQGMMRRISEKSSGRKRGWYLPNWVDLVSVRYDGEAGAEFRRKHGIPRDTTLVLYAGNLGKKQGLEAVLEAAIRLEPEGNVLFVIAGDGAARSGLETEAAARGVENLKFLPLQPESELTAMLSAADVHVVPQKAAANGLVLPSKLANIFAVGGFAVIGAVTGSEIQRMVETTPELAFLAEPEDGPSMAEAIGRAIEAKRRSGYNHAARRFAEEEWEREAVLSGFMERLETLVGGA